MPSVQDGLIHEATSLLALVDAIELFVEEHQSQFTYNTDTSEFFKHIRTLAGLTKKRLVEILEEAGRPNSDQVQLLREIAEEKDHWKVRHTYVKPAADAHTLNLPAPLIKMASEHLGRVQNADAQVVVLLTPETMYFHNRARGSIGDKRAFLEIPYSQSRAFFSNVIIYHELGHYVWASLSDEPRSPQFASLVDAQKKAFDEILLPGIQNQKNLEFSRRVLDNWTQELFCDLFALRHLGPASSFALIDFLSLISTANREIEVTFDSEHPALALRFREQYQRLCEDGWVEAISDMASDHTDLIRRLAAKPEEEYLFVYDDKALPKQFIDAFTPVIPFVHALVAEIAPQAERPSEDFRRWRGEIEDCLLNGVVPSKLLIQGSSLCPTPVSMINAAYCVYLSRLPELMNKLEGQDPDNPEHRRKWINRLEGWTMKAIDDYHLLSLQGVS